MIAATTGLGLREHVCWCYESEHERRHRVVEFLAEGVELGTRVVYLGVGARDALARDVRELGDVAGLEKAGVLELLSIGTGLGTARADPMLTVVAFGDTTPRALADGFVGLRVAADITPLVDQPDRLDQFARHEQVVDRNNAARPFSAMCAFASEAVGERGAAELHCVHQRSNDDAAGFRMYASGAHADLTIVGELDAFNAELFAETLRRSIPPMPGQDWVIDATQLAFLDHRAMATIDAHAARHGVPAVLQSCTPTARLIAGILDLHHVRVVEW